MARLKFVTLAPAKMFMVALAVAPTVTVAVLAGLPPVSERDSVPALTAGGPVEVSEPDAVRLLPPSLVKPPAPDMLPPSVSLPDAPLKAGGALTAARKADCA